MAVRTGANDPTTPASVWFRSVPHGPRTDKFAALGTMRLDDDAWTACPTDWRAPFLPASQGAWATYPKLDDLFVYDGSGVMPGRTWVIAPDAASLRERWDALVRAPVNKKDALFYPHQGGDRSVTKKLKSPLPGYSTATSPVGDASGPVEEPVRYAFRSFDRQWIVPDNRLINRPNPELWRAHATQQIYATALSRTSPAGGPAITLTALVPDLDHYKGSFGGRVFPLWLDGDASVANISPGFLRALTQSFGMAVDMGRRVVWLHTFGERFPDPSAGRPAAPPRLPDDRVPLVPANGAIPTAPDRRPPSTLGDIRPDHWLPEYTTELLDVLNVLGLLVDLEPAQADLLDRICTSRCISRDDLAVAGAFVMPESYPRKPSEVPAEKQQALLG